MTYSKTDLCHTDFWMHTHSRLLAAQITMHKILPPSPPLPTHFYFHYSSLLLLLCHWTHQNHTLLSLLGPIHIHPAIPTIVLHCFHPPSNAPHSTFPALIEAFCWPPIFSELIFSPLSHYPSFPTINWDTLCHTHTFNYAHLYRINPYLPLSTLISVRFHLWIAVVFLSTFPCGCADTLSPGPTYLYCFSLDQCNMICRFEVTFERMSC